MAAVSVLPPVITMPLLAKNSSEFAGILWPVNTLNRASSTNLLLYAGVGWSE